MNLEMQYKIGPSFGLASDDDDFVANLGQENCSKNRGQNY